MRLKLLGATAVVALFATGSAFAQQATITVWSWNVAASALKSTLEGFNKKYPDIKVDVQDHRQSAGLRQDAGCLRSRR